MNHQHHYPGHHLTLDRLGRIREWHIEHQAEHPLEYQVWDAILALWAIGWVGLLPAFALALAWAYPLCVLCILSPRLYVDWRVWAHRARRLRCDWLDCAG